MTSRPMALFWMSLPLPLSTSHACVSEIPRKSTAFILQLVSFLSMVPILRASATCFLLFQFHNLSTSRCWRIFQPCGREWCTCSPMQTEWSFKKEGVSGLFYLWILCVNPTPLYSNQSPGHQEEFPRVWGLTWGVGTKWLFLVLRLLDCFPKVHGFSVIWKHAVFVTAVLRGCTVKDWPCMLEETNGLLNLNLTLEGGWNRLNNLF